MANHGIVQRENWPCWKPSAHTSAPHAVPIFDPLTHIVYSAGRADVRHVFVDGQWRVRDRALTVFDMTETLEEIRALVPAIKESIA